jgi:hypothetical protein
MTAIVLGPEIKKLEGKRLRTLNRHKPFEIVAVSENSVIVLPLETQKERPIPREGIEEAYRHLTVTGQLTLAELENEYNPRNPVYTAAMLAEMPGVRYWVKPIRLRWTG